MEDYYEIINELPGTIKNTLLTHEIFDLETLIKCCRNGKLALLKNMGNKNIRKVIEVLQKHNYLEQDFYFPKLNSKEHREYITEMYHGKKIIEMLGPSRATKDYPYGKGISTVQPFDFSDFNKINQDNNLFKTNFNFICKVCEYIKEHGNKEDKKWIENLVWDKLIPVYKNNGVDKELVEHLIAQVTDCVAFKVDDK